MKTTSAISIIVPVYNVMDYLEPCIRSVAAQNFRDYELILVDDGATDDSGRICDEWAERDHRIRVIHQPNQGLSAARNAGIDVAEGKYLIFLDGDDFWKDPTVLERLADRLQLVQPDVLCFNFEKNSSGAGQGAYFSRAETMPLSSLQNSFEYLTQRDLWIACAWNKAVRRDLFDQNALRFRRGITSEDIDWCMRLALRAESFDFLDCVVVEYRQRETSISKTMTKEKVSMLFDNIETCLELLHNTEKCERGDRLKPYIAYQYGTALVCIAEVTDRSEKKSLLQRAASMRFLLNWSQNRKIKTLRAAVKGLGLRNTIGLLELRNKMKMS